MIAVDTSSMVAFLKGDGGSDVNAVEEGLRLKQVVIPPVVLSELLSAKNMSKILSERLQSIQMLEITEGYWVRVGSLRQHILRNGCSAKISADASSSKKRTVVLSMVVIRGVSSRTTMPIPSMPRRPMTVKMML